MGNQGSTALTDEPNTIAQRNLQHFDHSFKGDLHTVVGSLLNARFGEAKFAKRPLTIICKGNCMQIIEEVGISVKNECELNYDQIVGISWDHANSEVKLTLTLTDEDSFIILTLANSVEFEQEMKLRLTAAAQTNRNVKNPAPMYVGMFAGATKPKPFQRKRPNLSHLPSGKLPALGEMRNIAVDLHRGSYRPCPQGESRRMAIALQHIYEGHNTFVLLNVRGAASVANQYRSDSVLLITDEALVFKPRGEHSDVRVELCYDDIQEWNAIDNDKYRVNDSGIEVTLKSSGDSIYFGVQHVRDVKHTFEYFWNTFHAENGNAAAVKLGSTHGRPIVSVHTLSGEVPPPEAPQGQVEVMDQDGLVVRPGGKMAARRASLAAGVAVAVAGSKEPKVVPAENKSVKKHWHKVVMHQGWLLKQGGVGVGANKSWIKRYFVLYKTSQGHFLVYYSDFTECPMYTAEKNHRNIVDMAKATFIRPGSNKSDNPDTPPYCFDIVTTEREWTLCAESQENVQRWLQLITRAVDEDVAILPDEELIFKVKPKLDPLQALPATDYSTALKVSANGVSVCVPDANVKEGGEREMYFWVFTDFYKWSIMNPDGKLALLINVFADSSFSRRYEYIFRIKEAQRLATAIEYFIEKFMSVMHIRLETHEGAFDVPDEADATPTKRGLHEVAADDHDAPSTGQYGEELDLLGLDVSDSPMPAKAGGAFGGSPFGSDPFDDDQPSAPPAPSSSAPPVPPSTPAPVVDLFGDDPFGSDPFGAPAAPVPAAHAVKVAPPLSPAQIQQHKHWWLAALSAGAAASPIYNDGTLQIAAVVEVRGSQCRLMLQFVNQSPASISKLKVEIQDAAGLLRFEASPMSEDIAGLGKATQTVMCECMKPVAPGPKLSVSYVDALAGSRANVVEVPLVVCSFNEGIQLEGGDFQARWAALTGAGQEAQDVLKPPYPIVPAQIHAALKSTMKFTRVQGLPDASDYVVYGAASLKTGARTPAGEKINVGCLVKLEMSVQTNAVRVTFRTLHPAASAALLETTKALLC